MEERTDFDKDTFFRRLPKMTNNHIHLFALFPYKRLLKIIKKIDPELYHKIYVLRHDMKTETQTIYKYTMITFNEDIEGIPFSDVTTMNDWAPLSEFDSDPIFWSTFIIKQHIPKPFVQFEKIQSQVRVLIRHYKVYYYMWYMSIYANYHNRIYYLNVRGKPGTINKDVRHGHRLFIDSSNVMSESNFINKMTDFVRTDLDIKPQDIKYMYKQYLKIKYESDLILMAVYDFNTTHNYPSFVLNNKLFENKIIVKFADKFDSDTRPQMMVQYIITFPKFPKGVVVDYKKFIHEIKELLYIAIVINSEYGFQFFNGVDFVGNEQETQSLSDIVPYLGKLMYFRKYGIQFIPHIGETNHITSIPTPIEKYILEKDIQRIGHGISFITTDTILSQLESRRSNFYIESCPISNYLLGYYRPEDHPHRLVINNPHIKLMICSDDNGLFNYSTVTRDYMLIYKYWNLTLDQIKQLILNGMAMIPFKYRPYYQEIFNKLWINMRLDAPQSLRLDK
jgi:hypothetical protein